MKGYAMKTAVRQLTYSKWLRLLQSVLEDTYGLVVRAGIDTEMFYEEGYTPRDAAKWIARRFS